MRDPDEEHDVYRWCALEQALELPHWAEAKDALRALAQRLERPGLI